jgi:hypothetical protein
MTTRRKVLIGSVSSLIVIWFILGYVGAYFMVMPKNRDFEDVAELGGQPVTPLTLTTRDGVAVSAWHVAGTGEKAVIFAHGIGSSRKQGSRVAEQYAKRGYDVLMVDARGHGKSQPATCTIGWDERFDLLAAYDWLRDRGFETIGAHGISMGAATIAYSVQEDVDYDFVVLESCYDTIDNALRNRLAMFSVPMPVVFPFRLASQWQTGVGPDQLRPVDFMDRLTMPVLILAGDSEPELKVRETQALFDACGSEEKVMHLFKGGKHEIFLKRFEEEYLLHFERFLDAVETGAGARLAAA